jgi:hypothetical protein
MRGCVGRSHWCDVASLIDRVAETAIRRRVEARLFNLAMSG